MKKNIMRAAILVSLMTIISKPVGFIREAVIAAYFGASSQTDAFFLSQNMPALLFPAVCTSLSTAFLTIYVSKSIKYGEREGDAFASSAVVFNLAIAGILGLLAFVLSPIIVKIFAPGFDTKTLLLATKLTRIVMSAFIVIMLQYMLNAILNGKEFYVGSQIAGILYNLTIIGIIIIIGNKFGVFGLTLTFIGGYVTQSIMLVLLTKRRFKFKFPKNIINSDVKYMLKLAIPILLGNSVVQLNNIVDKILASKFMEGSVSALSYSNTLNSFVISIIITSLSTVLYPTMTDYISRDDKDGLKNSISSSIIMLILILMPISVITSIYAGDIVNIAYGRGSFDSQAVTLTSSILKYYGLSFVFIAIREVSTKLFYAYKDTKTPMINGAISVALNIISSVVLSRVMGIAGIALGTTLALFIATILFLVSIKKKIPDLSFTGFRNALYKIIIASSITTVSIIFLKYVSVEFSSFIRFILVTVLGFFIYIGVLYILKCDELIKINKLVKKRLEGSKS